MEDKVPESTLMAVHVSDHARIAIAGLTDEERRIVHSWLDHLRNWRNDGFIRDKSQRLEVAADTYVLRTSADIVIVFSIHDDAVLIVSVFRKEALSAFETAAAQTAR